MSEKQALYKQTLIKHLYFHKELSCAELSELTDKSLPFIARLLNDLMQQGVVIESGHALSTGGRRPQMYSLKADGMYTVSVAMDQFVTRIGMLDMHNRYIHHTEIELPLPHHPEALQKLGDILQKFITASGISKEKILGIGIGMPGFVDVTKGVNYSFLGNGNENIVAHIESVTGIPVMIDNDSSLFALAEWRLGAAREKRNAMVINIGWGIGLGLILNGKLFRGHNGFAGEFSHIPLFTNNKICNCGKMGCLETESSLLVILEKAIEGLKEGKASTLKNLSLDHVEGAFKAVMNAAVKGDKYAIDLISQAAYHIGRGVAILIHIMNPELIVLSGRGALAGKVWLAPIQQALNEHCIPRLADQVEVVISPLGYEGERLGSAALVMEHLEELMQHRKKQQHLYA